MTLHKAHVGIGLLLMHGFKALIVSALKPLAVHCYSYNIRLLVKLHMELTGCRHEGYNGGKSYYR